MVPKGTCWVRIAIALTEETLLINLEAPPLRSHARWLWLLGAIVLSLRLDAGGSSASNAHDRRPRRRLHHPRVAEAEAQAEQHD